MRGDAQADVRTIREGAMTMHAILTSSPGEIIASLEASFVTTVLFSAAGLATTLLLLLIGIQPALE